MEEVVTQSDRLPVTIIERRTGWRLVDLAELWSYRELVYFLTWRDVKVRYKQTALGALWALFQPLATMAVFCFFFGQLAKAPDPDMPYPLFVLAGVLPWIFFANALTSAGQSVVGNQTLVSKAYFPRLIIPLAAVAAGLVDFLVAFALLLVMMFGYGVTPSWSIFVTPVLMFGLVLAAVGIGALLAALTVAYRDFRHIVPFMMQMWMLVTPAVYLQAEGPLAPPWNLLAALNPAQGLIANFRAAALGSEFDLPSLLVSCVVTLALLLLGCLYFRRVEKQFADII